MAPVGLILLLLCAALGPSAATPVWCFARLEEAEGGGACVELLVGPLGPLEQLLSDLWGGDAAAGTQPELRRGRRGQEGLAAASVSPALLPRAGGLEPLVAVGQLLRDVCAGGQEAQPELHQPPPRLRGQLRPRGHRGDPGVPGQGPDLSRDPPGAPCAGSAADSQECPGLQPCPVDGAWGAWSAATPCPVTCGLGGVTLRRACDAPPPQHGGRACAGKDTRRGVCGPLGACPEVLHWGPWGPWSPCTRPLWESIACKSTVGQQRRTRACVGHGQGGPSCPAEGGLGTIHVRACYNIHNCLLHGNWSDWSPWGLCTPPCGTSPTRSRSRECRATYPSYKLTVTNVGSSGSRNVTFWGTPRPLCEPLLGQRLRLEETRPCLHVLPCPPDEE
ncbi:properdin [Manacus candei]|uniref:properdin n=1 Tax=Manacus candei TaxID=415023 RepID=UPI002228062C|nr:properdin [Manacus candei]